MIGPGTGQGIDTANPAGNWTNTSQYAGLMSESDTKLQYRDDFQFITAPIQNQPGLQLVPSTYSVFANNGSIPVNASVTQSTALTDLSNRTAVLSSMTTATDHLPVVADYTVALPPVIDWKGGIINDPTNWNDVADWNPSIAVPNKAGLCVSFGNQTSASNVVNMISQGQTVGSISFAATTSTTIISGGGYSLTLDNNGMPSSISVAGNHTISAPVVLDNDATMSGAGTLDLAGGITGPHDLDVTSGNLIASSICVNTLTLGAGCTVTISALPGGPSAGARIVPVPEPATWILLVVAAMVLLVPKQAKAVGVFEAELSDECERSESGAAAGRSSVGLWVLHGLGSLRLWRGRGGPEHPDSGVKVLASASQRLANLAEQAKEHVLPWVPCQQTAENLPPATDNLRRHLDQRPSKRGKVHTYPL